MIKHLKVYTARALAFVVFATVLVVSPNPQSAEAQASTGWSCDGVPILMQGGVLNYIVPDPANPGQLTVDPIAGTNGVWNSTAYDPITDLVLGVGSIGGEKYVRGYDASGGIPLQVQISDPYPDDANTYAGTVLGDGRYIIHSVGNGNGSSGWYNGARFNLWSIEIATGAATYIGSTPVDFTDFSNNPADGYLYQAVNRVLYKVDPNTGATTTQPMSSALPNGSFGASWFDSAGNLYLFRNNPGSIWKVDPDDPLTVTNVGTVGANGGTDGTNCVSSIDITKDVIDGSGAVALANRVYQPGDTVTYQFTLINNGLPATTRTADLCDVLPADGRTYTGAWTSTDPNTTLTSGGTAGDVSICLEAQMPSSLWTDPANPASDPTVITIDVVLGDDMAPGEYENQATLDHDQDGTVDVVSDDPGDGSDPRDPTTIEVLGGFTVSKTVIGHPTDNDTDTFPMTLVCTTASGAALDISAGSIVDAATGAPWPGATTNGFSISNGEEVRVNGLPAGATCQVTEADNLAYATTVAVADDGSTGGNGATSTGTPAAGALVSDNCQDGNGNAPFNLQIRNATGNVTNWEMIWRDRPYDTIPGLSAGPYTHAVVPTAGGLFDHVFTGTTPLNGWSNLAITGGTPTPPGAGGCGDVEHYIDGTGVGGGDGGGEQSSTAELTIDGAIEDEAVAFTNSTSTIELTKQTTATGAVALEQDDTFTFTLTCDNGISESISLTTSGGTATVGYPTTPLVAAGENCTVTETVPAGWELTTSNDVELVTDGATTQTAAFENTRQLADLSVTKKVVGLPDGEDPVDYPFEVEVSCTGGFADDPYTTTGTIVQGTPLVVEDLPVGASCTVVETPAPGFTTLYNPAQTVEIETDGAVVEVINSTGALIIDKTTQVPATHPIDPVDTFDFTIDCTGPDGATSNSYSVETDSPETSGASGGIAHADVGLKAPGTTCTVTELTATTPEWTLAGAGSVTLEITNADREPTASFLNVRNVGSLTVTKALDGVPAGIDLSDEPFTVDVSCVGGFTVSPYVMNGLTVTANTPLIIDDLPTGAACTVTEQPDPRFTPTGSPSTVTIDTDGETVPLTNSTSTFSLDKVTAGSALAGSTDSTFTFAIVCTDAGGTEVANSSLFISTTDGAGSADVSELPLVPPGSTCTVTETVPFGWTLTGRTGGTNSGASGIEFTTAVAGTTLEFENTLDSATLTIEKDVNGVAVTPALEAETFTVTVDCTGNFPGGTYTSGSLSVVEGTPVELTDLPAGSTCTVAEDADPRFATTYSPAPSVVIDPAGTTVTIENATSTFELYKETSVPADVEPDATFDFTIECSYDGAVIYTDTASITTINSNGSWLDAEFVPPGSTCSVTEAADSQWTPLEGNTITFTTSATLNENVTFTNERSVADLTITKTLAGDLTQDYSNTPFTVTVTCVGDFDTSPLELTGLILTHTTPLVVPDLPTGAVCTITEIFDSRFTTFYAPENADATSAVVTIEDGGTMAGITNAGGEIMIRKDTVGPIDHPLGLLDDFTFNFSCTNGYTGSHTIAVDEMSGPQGIGVLTYDSLPAFPLNAVCTITEVPPPGWATTSPNPQDVVIVTDKQMVQFVNERNAGTLTVTKVLDGVPAGVDLGDEPFIVDITCTGGGLTTDPYVIADQTVTANLPLSIANLPTGAECSVTEDADPRFTSAISSPVTIDDDGEEIVVTNTTSTLSISKATTGPTTHPITLDDTFTFVVNCTAPGGAVLYSGTHTITTVGQTGTWATPDTPLVPPGTDCSVTEQTPPLGWTNTTATTQTVTTTDASVAEAAFTNERVTGELSLIKTIVGSPVDLSAEEFIVDISCTGGFTTEPYLITGVTITEAGAPAIADLPAGAACVVTERDDIRFLPSYGPDDATAIIVEGGSSVDIDNRTGTFRVEKQIDVAGTQPVDLTETFLIDATCTDGSAFTLTLDVVDGVTTTSAYPDVPLLPDGTACTVTEQTPPTGWTLATPNDIEVIISSGTEPTVSFTNERDTADLTVTKTVIGAPAGLDLATEVFTVDISCTGDFDSSPLVFADRPIMHGETITIPDLPTGSTCTVVEEPDDRFAITTTPVDAATAGVEITDTGADVAIVNATGEIMIVKNTQVTTALPVDVTESFTFDIDCGAAYTATHTIVADTTTSPTTATGFVRYDDIAALPNGTDCIITEQATPTGWTLVSPNDVPLTVDSAGVVTATFTNERDTGDLTVTKTLDGVPAGTDLDAFAFDVEVTCAGGFTTANHVVTGQISVDSPLTITDVPTGSSCAVVETPDPRFGTAVGAAAVVDTDGETINVTNTTSTLSITKTTTGPATHPIDLDDTFIFDVSCTSPGGTVLFTGVQTISTASQTGTWATPDTPLLPPGTECSVAERPATGWTATTPTDVTVTTDSASIVDAAFTNERDTGELTITKTLEGVPADVDLDAFAFDVEVTCAGGFTTATHVVTGQISADTPLTIADLPTDSTCSVVETADLRFSTAVGAAVDIDTDGETINVTNSTGTFDIRKEVTTDGAQPIDLSGTFLIDTTCDDGTSFTTTMDVVDGVAVVTETADIPLLPTGTACTISEQTPPTGWTLTSANDISIVIASTTEPVISFTNERDTADLTVTKTVIGAPAGLDLAAEIFTVDISCSGDFDSSPLVFADRPIMHGETITIPDLPTGSTCTVAEDPDDRFATSSTPIDAGTAGVTITDAGADVAILNATGEIMIVKNTQVTTTHPIDVAEDFDFVVDCGATYSGTHTLVADTATSATTATGFLRYDDLPALPNGTDCTITEQTPPTGWTLVSSNDIPLTVDSAGVVTATFTNERDTGDLTITKTLDGVPAGTDLDAELFDVEVTCAGGFTTATHVVTGQISVDTPLTITELPTGSSCAAVETPDARFSTVVDTAVAIDTDGETINVTNTTSTLAITKATTGPTTHPIDLDDAFSFDVTCSAADGTELYSGTQTITTSSQAGTWATPDTPLLPPGTDCSITEQPATGWTAATPTDVTVTTDSAGIVEAAFTNDRDAGELTITKTLDGVPAGTDLDAELFDVVITCIGGFTSATHSVTGQISVDTPLTIADLPTGATCDVAETADARFSTSIEPPVDIDADGETVNVTNTTSTLSITKITEGPTTHPLNLDETFTFDVTCAATDGTVLHSSTQAITTASQTGSWATPDTPLLPPGTSCTVIEQAPPTGWTNSSGETQTVDTDAATIVDAEFTNVRDTATLTVNKTVLGAPDGIDLSDTLFDVTVTCVDGFTTSDHVVTGQVSANTPLDIPDLPTGATCEIVEADDARFATSYFPENATGEAATALIADDGDAVTITNSTGAVIVAKQTIVSPLHPIDPVDDFTFTIDCGAVYTADHTLTTDLLTTSGSSGVIFYTDLPLIPEGTPCDVTEHDETPEWTLATDRTVSLIASSTDPVTAAFTNTRTETQLSINKQIEAPETVDLSAESFEVTVSCSGGFTEDPYVLVGTMSATAPFVIDELPYGAECSAVETPDDRFTTTDLTGAVTLASGPAAIDILNQTGSFTLDLDAIVNSTRPIDPDDDFQFTVTATLPDGTVLTETLDLTTLDGTGAWESALFPTGTVVTVSLEPPAGWNLTDRDGTLVGANAIELEIGTDVGTMAFEVQRDLASLTISKELANIPSNADFTDHTFDISVTCSDGFETSSYELPDAFTVSNTTPLVIDDLPTGSTCEVAEAADEFFTASYAPDNTITVLADASANELIITNTGNDALEAEYATPAAPLAFTGRTVANMVLMAMLLMLAGVFFVRISTRRRDA